jgi:hypothetical protein
VDDGWRVTLPVSIKGALSRDHHGVVDSATVISGSIVAVKDVSFTTPAILAPPVNRANAGTGTNARHSTRGKRYGGRESSSTFRVPGSGFMFSVQVPGWLFLV